MGISSIAKIVPSGDLVVNVSLCYFADVLETEG